MQKETGNVEIVTLYDGGDLTLVDIKVLFPANMHEVCFHTISWLHTSQRVMVSFSWLGKSNGLCVRVRSRTVVGEVPSVWSERVVT